MFMFAAPFGVSQANDMTTNQPSVHLSVQWKARLAANGIALDSERDRVLTYWLNRISTDPAWHGVIHHNETADSNGHPDDFEWTNIPPEVRLEFAHRLRSIIAGLPQSACEDAADRNLTFPKIFNSVSASDLDTSMRSLDVALKAPRPDNLSEHYGTSELLAMESQANANLQTQYEKHKWAWPRIHSGDASHADRVPNQCEMYMARIDAIDNLPEPQRSQATWASVASRQSQTLGAIADGVLADPASYLDEAFDERLLPESFRRQLLVDAGQRLPFHRLKFRGQWIRTGEYDGRGPFETIVINRRDNGVVAGVLSLMTKRGEPSWASFFYLDYGKFQMSTQMVAAYPYLGPVARLPDDSGTTLDFRPIAEHSRWQIPLPQPNADGIKTMQCSTQHNYSAAKVFASLTGSAVDFICRPDDGSDSHTAIESRGVWLYEYGVAFLTASIRKGDVMHFHLDDVLLSR